MSAFRRIPRTVLATAAGAALAVGLVAPAAAFPGSSALGSSSTDISSQIIGAGEPKKIIYMIGDGVGYNHVAAANLYDSGQTRYQVEGEVGSDLSMADGEAVQVYEGAGWNKLAMTTFQEGNSYDVERAWADHDYVNESYTDSAAAGTAMDTGVKTSDGSLGVGSASQARENTSERAKDQGKSAGVVSDVPFSHATPAAWAAHVQSRNDYHEIARQMISGDLDVIMGAGHPFFSDDNVELGTADYRYIAEAEYNSLVAGETDFEYFDNDEAFAALAAGEVEADTRYFGLAQVASTLQQSRSGESTAPYSVPQNDVVDLDTMSKGALNVLGQDEDGFHLMIEAGAIDWAGHANDISRDIEEVREFNSAVEAVVAWVEENSSWDETLLIVTADHETGYLSGADEGEVYNALIGEKGAAPEHEYYSGNHTDMVVPFFFRGAGSQDILGSVTGTDKVRGDFIDNVTVAELTLDKWWARG